MGSVYDECCGGNSAEVGAHAGCLYAHDCAAVLEQFDDAERVLRDAGALDTALAREPRIRMENTMSGLLRRLKATSSDEVFRTRAVEFARRPIERVAVVFDCQQRRP